MALAYIIEDEPAMAECLALIVEGTKFDENIPFLYARTFGDAITAMSEIPGHTPDVILLDVMLTGPNGFTFLNELASYSDTAKIPVILISSVDFSGRDLAHYGVICTLDKATMNPEHVQAAVRAALSGEKINTESVPALPAPSASTLPAPAEIPALSAPSEAPALSAPADSAALPEPDTAPILGSGLADLNRRIAEAENAASHSHDSATSHQSSSDSPHVR